MTARTDLRIPGRRPGGYSMAKFGTPSDNKSPGRFVIQAGASASYWKPAWGGKETIIRILPSFYADGNGNQVFEGFRYTDGNTDFCDWIRCYPAVRSFGLHSQVTMLLCDVANNPNYDATTNPCFVLYRAIQSAVRTNTAERDWPSLLMGAKGQGAALTKPTTIALVQAAIYTHGDRPTFQPGTTYPRGLGPTEPTVIFELPFSAYKSLLTLWNEKNRDADLSEPPDWENYYTHGDPVSIEHGRFIHIYEVGHDPRARFAHAANTPPGGPTGGMPMPTGAGGAGQQGTQQKGYDVFMTKTYPGIPTDNGQFTATLSGWEEVLKSKWKPWDSLLRFMTEEEQAHVIARLFPASAILYAFRDHPDWIPEDVRTASVGKVTTGFDPAHNYGGNTPIPAVPIMPPNQPPVSSSSLRPPTSPTLPPPGGTTKSPAAPTAHTNVDAAVPSGGIPDNEIDEVAKAKAAIEAMQRRRTTAS